MTCTCSKKSRPSHRAVHAQRTTLLILIDQVIVGQILAEGFPCQPDSRVHPRVSRRGIVIFYVLENIILVTQCAHPFRVRRILHTGSERQSGCNIRDDGVLGITRPGSVSKRLIRNCHLVRFRSRCGCLHGGNHGCRCRSIRYHRSGGNRLGAGTRTSAQRSHQDDDCHNQNENR